MFPEPGYESITVSCINSNGKDVKALNQKLAEKGYMISGGYGKLADKTFRIGHMGEWNLAGIKDVIAQIDSYLGIVVTIKILVSDKIADEGIKTLQEEGYQVTRGWDIPKPDLPKIIGEYDVLIVRQRNQSQRRTFRQRQKTPSYR